MRMLGLGVVIGLTLTLLAVALPMALAHGGRYGITLPAQAQVPQGAPFAPVPGTPGLPPIQELVPIPEPNDQQGQGQQPQQGQDCPILFYFNGQLYQLRPGPGPRDGRGGPGSPPEFFYLNPYQGPPIPGFPMPDQAPPGFPQPYQAPPPGPNFRSVQPRS